MFTRRSRAKLDAVSVRASLAIEESDHFSWSAEAVLRTYRRIPVSSRPTFDVEAVLAALDLKYGDRASHHVTVHDVYGAEHVDPRFCACVARYDHEGDLDFDDKGEYKTGRDCEMPEYAALVHAMEEILDGLEARKRILESQAHQAELDGVRVHLDSIEALTQALRAERDIIADVNELISS